MRVRVENDIPASCFFRMISAAASLFRCCSEPEAVFLLFCHGRSASALRVGFTAQRSPNLPRQPALSDSFLAPCLAGCRVPWLLRGVASLSAVCCGCFVALSIGMMTDVMARMLSRSTADCAKEGGISRLFGLEPAEAREVVFRPISAAAPTGLDLSPFLPQHKHHNHGISYWYTPDDVDNLRCRQ